MGLLDIFPLPADELNQIVDKAQRVVLGEVIQSQNHSLFRSHLGNLSLELLDMFFDFLLGFFEVELRLQGVEGLVGEQIEMFIFLYLFEKGEVTIRFCPDMAVPIPLIDILFFTLSRVVQRYSGLSQPLMLL